MFALAGGSSVNGASYLYGATSGLNDVADGSNGACGTYLCTAEPGYDGPTGVGTPNGVSAFPACARQGLQPRGLPGNANHHRRGRHLVHRNPELIHRLQLGGEPQLGLLAAFRRERLLQRQPG